MKRYLLIPATLGALAVGLLLTPRSSLPDFVVEFLPPANAEQTVDEASAHRAQSVTKHWPPITEKECKPTTNNGGTVTTKPQAPVHIQVQGVDGADISEYEGNVDFTKLAKQKKFVIMRFSHGGHADTNYATFWQQAQKTGIIKGAYVYLDPSDPMPFADQLKRFVNGVKLDKGDLPPILDAENPCLWIKLTPDQRLAYILKWANALEKVYGVKPIIYMNRSFTDRALAGSNIAVLKQYPLWLASYQQAVPSSIPDPWDSYIIWQYSEDAPLAGVSIPADADVAPGSLATLQSYTLQQPAGGDASVLSASDLDIGGLTN
jgi:lysozyme